jgi:hypothetical protein
MTYTANILEAKVAHVNGGATTKEMRIFAHGPAEDGDGQFGRNLFYVFPVPWTTEIGERPELIGKRITITINEDN